MADRFTKEQISEFMKAFSLFDKDGDGSISQSELSDVLKSVGLNCTEKEVTTLMAEVDPNSDGILDFPEFLLLLASRTQTNEDEEVELNESFKVYDLNKDGLISAQELKFVMADMGERLTDEEVQEMMREADLDGDGCLNFEEFRRMMTISKG